LDLEPSQEKQRNRAPCLLPALMSEMKKIDNRGRGDFQNLDDGGSCM
jgi:hypothetical protein